jgi:hypothetical protein
VVDFRLPTQRNRASGSVGEAEEHTSTTTVVRIGQDRLSTMGVDDDIGFSENKQGSRFSCPPSQHSGHRFRLPVEPRLMIWPVRISLASRSNQCLPSPGPDRRKSPTPYRRRRAALRRCPIVWPLSASRAGRICLDCIGLELVLQALDLTTVSCEIPRTVNAGIVPS